jgi:predicted Fe-Mo cluster-binding NifX family protein
MKICIPTIGDKGFDDKICEHFGGSRFFTVFDTETNDYQVIPNIENREHGNCAPIDLIKDKGTEILVCEGLGKRAIQRLNSAGIKVYRNEGEASIKDVLEKATSGKLEEFDIDNCCGGHEHHQRHTHHNHPH